jgi:hypothetical protein
MFPLVLGFPCLHLRGASFGSRIDVFLLGKAEIVVETRQVFIALLSAMPAVTRRSAAEVAYLKSAAATDPPRRIERLFFRFETLVDSEQQGELVNRSHCCVAPKYLPTAIRK